MWLYWSEMARTCRNRVLTFSVIDGLRRESVVTESGLFLFRLSESGGLPSLRFKLPSDVGVRMPERGRDASASGRMEEDMNRNS